MKTRRHIFGGLLMAAAALVCLTGCKKDDEGEKITLGVDFEQTAGMQKTYIGNEDKTIYWSTDDQVKVNGTNYLVHDGVVEVNMCEDGYAAVYPATEGNTLTYSGGTSGRYCTGGSVVIPATQNYTTDVNTGVQKLNAPMAARLDTKTGRLLFRNLYAVIKVTVKAKASSAFSLSSITLESANSVNLAGTQAFTFDAATNTATPTLGSLTNGSTYVTLNFGTPVTIPANNSASFYLYTAEFSEANLNVKLNGSLVDHPATARTNVAISRSQLRGTTVDAATATPEGALSGVFSVSATKKVYFSQGNLQYQASTQTWRFAEHQYDFIGDAAGNTTAADNRALQTDWIDLFGWGTSGYADVRLNTEAYQPWTTSESSEAYQLNGVGSTDLSGKTDWGYNRIANGGNTENSGWRTLTSSEWNYLINTRTVQGGSGEGKTCVRTTVGGVYGLIIFPDDYKGSTSGLTAIPEGCAFLPAAGYRSGTTVTSAATAGNYWSSTHGNPGFSNGFTFSGSTLPQRYLNYDRPHGRSVRLVKDVK